jgi:uncharacterized protein YndB with AHSA1/START domain
VGYRVTVQRTIDASAAQAFECFAQAELLNKWFTTGAKQQFRIGGRYSNDDFDEGIFIDIAEPSLIRFTWENAKVPSGGEVTVRIRELEDGRCQVAITQSGMPAQKWVAEQREGWSWASDSLKALLETGKGIRYGEWDAQRRARLKAREISPRQ